MANLNVPSAFSTIRAAINAAVSGDTIVIAAGTYDVTAGGAPATLAYINPVNNPGYNATGFNPVTSLSYTGAGRSGGPTGTTLTGNTRLYAANVDGGLANSPISVSYSGFQVQYTSPGSNYILSAGRTGTRAQNTSGTTVANTRTKSITINNVQFSGTNQGNAGATGNYIDVAGIQTISFTNNLVNVTGQAAFTGSTAISGGSSFLLMQGGQTGSITITGNGFNESGFRNSFSIYDSANVTIASNTFTRTAGTQFVRTNSSGDPKSNKIANSTNVTVGGATSGSANTFSNGSFLALEGGSGLVRFNTFDGTNMAAGSSGAIGVSLEGSTAPSYTFTNNAFVYVSPFVNSTSSPIFVTTAGTSDNTFRNPNTGNPAALQQFITGTTGNDTLTSTLNPAAPNRRDFISGGLGNDVLDGGTGTAAVDADFFLFNTTLNSTTNVDTIINWTPSFLSGSPDVTNNQRDQLVLDRKIFKNLTVTSNVSGNPGLGLGQLAAATTVNPPSTAGGQVIANTNGTFTSSTSIERIALATGGTAPGSLYYQAGDGTSPFLFARLTTGTIASGSWVTSLNQLGAISVI
jgi:hypothetical protein